MATSEKTLELIYDRLDYMPGIVSSSEQDRITPVQRQLFKETKKRIKGISSAYFSGDTPVIYFCSLTKFSNDTVRDIHKKVWNQNRVPLLFVVTPGEVRIYNSFHSPASLDEDIESESDPRRLERILEITNDTLDEIKDLSRINLDTGKYWESEEIKKRYKADQRLDRHLLNNLKKAREDLIAQNLDYDTIHDLLARCIFISYLNDRAAIGNGFYKDYVKDANCFADILGNKKATYSLFDFMHEKFNGDMFPVTGAEKRKVNVEHLLTIQKFLSGKMDMTSGQTAFWSLYDFYVIPIQLISAIYEEFLSKRGDEKKQLSAYYTPHFLAEFIMDEVLPWPGPGEEYKPETVMDISCGSGIFLVESYRRIVEKWTETNVEPGKRIPVKELRRLLTQNIYGVDKAAEAVKVTAFSLYLAMLNYILEPSHIWNQVRFPNLIYKPDKNSANNSGSNLFISDAFDENLPFNDKSYDIIVGNPPWKNKVPENVKEYCKNNDHPATDDISQSFLLRSGDLCPNGRIAMLATSMILVNVGYSYPEFRESFFSKYDVDTVVNFAAMSKQLFNDANMPACCIFFKAQTNNDISKKMLYVTPKSIIAQGKMQKILLSPPDIKFIPQKQAADNASVWKSGLWGSYLDYEQITKFSRHKSFEDLSADKTKIDRGYEEGTKEHEITVCSSQYIGTPSLESDRKNILNLYHIETNGLTEFSHKKVRRLGFDALYSNVPKVLFKEGSYKDWNNRSRIWTIYSYSELCFNRSFYGIQIINGTKNDHKALCVYLNSKISYYYVFYNKGALGVGRNKVTIKELENLPVEFLINNIKCANKLAEIYDQMTSEIIKKHNSIFDNSALLDQLEDRAFNLIADAMRLDQDQRQLIIDRTENSIDYFFKRENSKSCYPPDINELKMYCKKYSEVMNKLTKFGKKNIESSVYEGNAPLSVVSFQLTEKNGRAAKKVKVNKSDNITELLKKLDERAIELYQRSLYVSRFFRIYDGNVLYVIKPSEKRFWTRSEAIADARETINEILAQEYGV